MSMSTPHHNRVQHQVCLCKQNEPISTALLFLGQAICRFYLMAALSSSTRKALIYSSKPLIGNSSKLAITLMSINSRMEKEIMIDTQNRLLYSSRKEQTSHTHISKESVQREYVE